MKKSDLLYISNKFDELDWWKEVGLQVKHDFVYLVAPPIIAIPSSNGHWNLFSVLAHGLMIPFVRA